MQGTIKAGIDGVNITFPMEVEPETIISTLFPSADFKTHFKPVINTGMPKALKKIQWYGMSYFCRNAEGAVLLALHTNPQACFGKRNLLQIHGLCFSNYATNPFRPLDLQALAVSALTLGGTVTSMDVYIDDCAGITPLEDVYTQSLPFNYRQYIRSPCVQDKSGMPVQPHFENNGIYYGLKRGNNLKVLFYQKNKDPHQGIAQDGYGTKFVWSRWEFRLRSNTAKMVGGQLLEDIAADPTTIAGNISAIFHHYFNFVSPDSKRSSRRSVQPWWNELLKNAC